MRWSLTSNTISHYVLADVESTRVKELKRRLPQHEGEENSARKSSDRCTSERKCSWPRQHRSCFRALKTIRMSSSTMLPSMSADWETSPHRPRQERQLLDAKLRQKQRYATTLRDMGLGRDRFRLPSESTLDHRSPKRSKVTSTIF